jgi:hypothetical protein
METAAAIVAKLAFEQNDQLKSQLQAFTANRSQGAEVIIPGDSGGVRGRRIGPWRTDRRPSSVKLANTAQLSGAIVVLE